MGSRQYHSEVPQVHRAACLKVMAAQDPAIWLTGLSRSHAQTNTRFSIIFRRCNRSPALD